MAQHGPFCKLSLTDIFVMLKHGIATSDSVNGGLLLFYAMETFPRSFAKIPPPPPVKMSELKVFLFPLVSHVFEQNLDATVLP